MSGAHHMRVFQAAQELRERLFDVGAWREASESKDVSEVAARSLVSVARLFVRRELLRLHVQKGSVDDYAQEVMLRVWRQRGRVKAVDASHFFAWIWRVAHSVSADLSKHERRLHRIEAVWPGTVRLHPTAAERRRTGRGEGEPRTDSDPVDEAMVKERELVIAQAISQLTERKRDALMRCVIQGESLAAIAMDHGVSARTTQRDVQEALRLLQSLLKRVGS